MRDCWQGLHPLGILNSFYFPSFVGLFAFSEFLNCLKEKTVVKFTSTLQKQPGKRDHNLVFIYVTHN